MKNIFLLAFIAVLLSVNPAISGIAERPNLPEIKKLRDIEATKQKKVFVGGDVGVTFGDYTEVRLSPLIGYRFSNQISGGVKFVYRFAWQKTVDGSGAEITDNQNSYGGNAFIQYNPIPEFYTKAEYSYQVYKNKTTQGTEDKGVPFLFLGLGYTRMLAPNVYLNAGLKVDVLNNLNSPFKDYTPFFDVGINVGI